MVCDFAWPEPDPPPFTTVAWRLAHVSIGIFALSATYPAHAADAEPFLAGAPMAEIDLHVNREAIDHLAEVLVIRDLWRNRQVSGA
jgi:hypothetical protein